MNLPPWVRITGLVIGHALFWGWNLLFLSILAFGLGPEIFVDLVKATWIGLIPPVFAVTCAVLMVAPVLSIVLGLWRFRADPGRLLTLFYGVQAPIMFVALLRLFAFQQLNTPATIALFAFSVGAAALLWTVSRGPEVKSTPGQVLLLIGQATYGVCGLWAASALGLVTVPLTGYLIQALFEIPLSALLMLSFMMVNAVIMALFPVAMIGLSLRAWALVHGRTAKRLGQPVALGISAGTVAVLGIAVVAVTAVQPQERAYALLEAGDPAAANSGAEVIREGLVEAHLWRQRYLSDASFFDGLEDYWDRAFFDGAGYAPAGLARGLFAPFIFRSRDPEPSRRGRWSATGEPEASAAYAAFFDEPIDRAERETLLDAQQSTWMWQDAAASILDVGQQRVWLDEQDITVKENGDHAVVTVHDVYRNRTWEQREVVVYFSLPETAALTGLWLGHTGDRDEAFTHVVAPRGAAQQVYREQVQTNRDPALLEQVGPRQYRLRAFPIEPRTGDIDDLSAVTDVGPTFHLWMELQVLATPDTDGALHWPMPDVAEIRNLYWDEETERTVDGAPATHDGWLPETLPRSTTTPRATHDVALDGWRVRLAPVDPTAPAAPDGAVVVIDTSRSMADLRPEIEAALATLEPTTLLCAVPAGVVPCSWEGEGQLFYGSVSLIETLRALEDRSELSGARELFVLTDQGTYDQATDGEPLSISLPLWLVHLDGLPLAYADAVLDVMTGSGGGVGVSAEEVLLKRGGSGVRAGWSVRADPDEEAIADPTAASLHAIAAHAAIEAQAGWSDPAALGDLDALHALAVQHDVVSPYSSMLVLVDDAQRRRLAELEAQEDRFEREAESAAAAEDSAFSLTAVPEPEEWLLMLLGVAALLGMRMRQG